MKALYMRGRTPLSDDERAEYKGCRIENAEAFTVVATGVTDAVVAGDFPDIVAALKDAGIKAKVVKLSADKEATKAVATKAATVKAEQPAHAEVGQD